MKEPHSQILETLRTRLFTAVVGDVLDAAGRTCQFLPPEIKPLEPGMILAGWAMPVLEADCHGDTVAHREARQSFLIM